MSLSSEEGSYRLGLRGLVLVSLKVCSEACSARAVAKMNSTAATGKNGCCQGEEMLQK